MNSSLSKYLFYYPVTLARGELVYKYLKLYRQQQWLTPAEIQALQLQKLKALLLHASNNSQFYRSLFNDCQIDPKSIAGLHELSSLPTISKADVVSDYNKMKSSTRRILISSKTTGGSTGQPVTIDKNPDALARERAATWRAYEWAGVRMGDYQGRFWGMPLTMKGRILSKAVDFVSNRSRLSAFNINEDSLDRYYERLVSMRPVYLYGYVSMIAAFAEHVDKKQYPPLPTLKAIITTSEVLDDLTRDYLKKVFSVGVYNEYGCGEVGSIAHECEYGCMHIMAENLVVEVDNHEADSKGEGELIVTDLHNLAMPLIRYRLGDYAALSGETCACGRGLPVIKKIHGRAYDRIVDPGGRSHHPELLMYIFEDLKKKSVGIKQFQVIQKTVDCLDVYIVPEQGYVKDAEAMIVKLVHDNLHPGISCVFKYTEEIFREKSGKLRVIKSEVELH